jgi:hypothetical protein
MIVCQPNTHFVEQRPSQRHNFALYRIEMDEIGIEWVRVAPPAMLG